MGVVKCESVCNIAAEDLYDCTRRGVILQDPEAQVRTSVVEREARDL